MFAEYVSEGDCSSATPEFSIHTEVQGSQQTGSPSSVQPASIPETPLASIQSSPANYTQDFTSASQSHSRQVRINVVFIPCCISVFCHVALMVAEFILSSNIVTPKVTSMSERDAGGVICSLLLNY